MKTYESHENSPFKGQQHRPDQKPIYEPAYTSWKFWNDQNPKKRYRPMRRTKKTNLFRHIRKV